MIELVIFAAIAALLLVLMFWTARARAGSGRPAPAAADLSLEEMFPTHYRHFPQIRQALSSDDEEYLRQRAPRGIARRSRAERRGVALQFLAGLEEDFSRLHRLGRTVAALSPKVSRKQEAERLWLWWRFWIHLRLVSLSLRTGLVPVPQLARLTQLVGGLAAEIEAAMAKLEEAGGKRLRTTLSV
jgi:hypothetical protein